MWIYLNNRFVSKRHAMVSVFDHGFLYGDGVFETMRAYRGQIFLLSRHLDRLAEGARRLALPLPKADLLERKLYETLRRNHLSNVMLRLTVTRGVLDKPTVVIFPKQNRYKKALYRTGVMGQIVSIRRNRSEAQDPAIKAISFLNNLLAKQEAKGPFEAIMLNSNRVLAEGSISNLFWIKKGVLYTPALSVGILAGLTRERIIALAKENRIPVKEGAYREEALFTAEEAFLTNTGLEVMPLVRVNKKKIGTGQPGELTQRVRRLFQKEVSEQC
jgi:branched-chain amino acid aminotransferase